MDRRAVRGCPVSPHRRGATEDPHPDYLDTARDQDPRHEKTRPDAHAGKHRIGTGNPSDSNQKGKTMISPSASTAPEGFAPVEVPRLRTILATELQGDLQVVDRWPRDLHAGPRHRLPIGVLLEEFWTPELGHVIRRADTSELIPSAAIRAALRALVDGWSEISRHARSEAAPHDWTPIHRRDGLPAAEWRGPMFAAPGGAIPDLQVHWTAASGAYLVRADNGGALVQADVQGTLAGLRAALDALP